MVKVLVKASTSIAISSQMWDNIIELTLSTRQEIAQMHRGHQTGMAPITKGLHKSLPRHQEVSALVQDDRLSNTREPAIANKRGSSLTLNAVNREQALSLPLHQKKKMDILQSSDLATAEDSRPWTENSNHQALRSRWLSKTSSSTLHKCMDQRASKTSSYQQSSKTNQISKLDMCAATKREAEKATLNVKPAISNLLWCRV